MLKRISIVMLPVIALFFLLAMTGQPAKAAVYAEYGNSGYASDYYNDRITSEYRRGYQVDDWVERGDSSVTDSPLYEDGIRLAAWASQYEEDVNYALASAIYFFEVPRNARSIRVKVSYDGEGDRFDSEDNIAGRIWIKRSRDAEGYTEYYPDEGRYEDFEKPLYGDTFALRAKKNYEIIRISADDHVVDNIMELHVVAEGGQRVDVKYIEVETYTYLPTIRVVTRYYSDYVWQPWYSYAYWYFYTGPIYNFSDYYYVRYTYPNYHTHYVEVRKRYNHYLTVYYSSNPHRPYVGWAHVHRGHRDAHRGWDRSSLNRWTSDHDQARRVYSTVTTSTTRTRSSDIQRSRESFRSVLSTRTRLSPSESRAGTVRSTTTPATRQSTSVRTETRSVESRVNNPSDVRSRTTVPESRRSVETRSTSETTSRIQRYESQSSRSQTPERSSVRTQTETKVRSESNRTPAKTQTEPSRSSTPSQSERKIEIKRNTTRSGSSGQQNSSSNTQTRIRSESSRSKAPEKKVVEPKKVESKTQINSKAQTQNKAPEKKVETSKSKDDDDEDDDEDKKKDQSSSNTRSSSSRVRSEVRSR